MSYSMMGAVGAGSFKLVNGVAKPLNDPPAQTNLSNFKAFQQELSRFGALRVDGDIGPATVKLYNKVTGGSHTASQIATAIPGITLLLKGLATKESLPPAKPLPPSRPVAKSDGTVGEGAPPPHTPETMFDTAVGFVTSPLGIAALAGGVGLLFLLGRKKKSSSSAPAAAPAAVAIPKIA